jgi:N-acetyl-1-D-myo-inositol-2-amino-2-deoxy-alpha-D-glucopyranoside deacetylase
MSGGVLLVIAHPDDEILCGAGTIALCAQRGERVHVVCATRGEYGPIADPDLATPETLAEVREAELRASCDQLGVSQVSFLDLPDAGVDWAAEEHGTVDAIADLIREERPRILMTFGDDGVYGHGDHTAVHELSRAAVELVDHPPRLFFPVWTAAFVRDFLGAIANEGRRAQFWHLGIEHFLAEPAAINVQVDVTSVLPRKLAALRCHRTQLERDHAFIAASPAVAQRFLSLESFHAADGGSPLE